MIHVYIYIFFSLQDKKPLIQRRRRERINNSLKQLALLLKDANLVSKDKPLAKMWRADILEMVVQCLKGAGGLSTPAHSSKSQNANEISTSSESENGCDCVPFF